MEYAQEEGASGQSGSSSPPSSYVLKFASVRVGDSSSEKVISLVIMSNGQIFIH